MLTQLVTSALLIGTVCQQLGRDASCDCVFPFDRGTKGRAAKILGRQMCMTAELIGFAVLAVLGMLAGELSGRMYLRLLTDAGRRRMAPTPQCARLRR